MTPEKLASVVLEELKRQREHDDFLWLGRSFEGRTNVNGPIELVELAKAVMAALEDDEVEA